MTPERALEQAQAWLVEPHRLYRTLAVRGVPGSGKTAFLSELASRISGAAHVDCRVRSADDFVTNLPGAWGVTDSDSPWVAAPKRNDIVLTSPGDEAERSRDMLDLLTRHPALLGLAAAELRTVSLPVWGELCRCPGMRVSLAELANLAESCPTVWSSQEPPSARARSSDSAANRIVIASGGYDLWTMAACCPRPWSRCSRAARLPPGRASGRPARTRRGRSPSTGERRPSYLLGKWTGGQVLLDGGTGRLYRDTTGGSPDPVAGSSLTQFFATVRLYDEFRRTHFPYVTDHKDAQDNLARWHEHIDPAASRAETWTLILKGYDFEDSTWDLASYGLEWI
ncbi:hypothetical protein [Streptomyces viridochromogenes]|uniref:hypothetical protein n=1 Tax=Streptomyces viridochromogenes TaxID=1938 RepID=UPI0031D23C97